VALPSGGKQFLLHDAMTNPEQRRRMYQYPDDDEYGQYSSAGTYPTPSQRYQHQQWQRYRLRNEPEPPLRALFSSAQRWLRGDGAHDSGNSLGMGMALLAIFLFQFRGTLVARVKRNARHIAETWDDGGPFLVLYDAFDGIRSYFFISLDFIQRLRLIIPFSGNWSLVDRVNGGAQLAESDCPTKDGKSGRRRRLYDATPVSPSIPELEIIPLVDGDPLNRKILEEADPKCVAELIPCRCCGSHLSRQRAMNNCQICANIEPAFLRSDEYPDGWLEYDPINGVVPKKSTRRKGAKT